MNNLYQIFSDRKEEVETYLDFLESLENSARLGPPKLENSAHNITTQQQKILYSSVYLQLYNLVESTITQCINAVSLAATQNGSWQAKDLTESLRSEWVRGVARTHTELSVEKRFIAAMALCTHLIDHRPISELLIEKGGGGNWDDTEIENISRRIGFTLSINQEVYRNIKRPFKDDKGCLQLVKKLRNDLAHGNISFGECANEVAVTELRDIKNRTVCYLEEVVNNFIGYIERFEYLVPEQRPRQNSE